MTKQQRTAIKDLNSKGRNAAAIATLLSLTLVEVTAVLDKTAAKARPKAPPANQMGICAQTAYANQVLWARLQANARPIG